MEQPQGTLTLSCADSPVHTPKLEVQVGITNEDIVEWCSIIEDPQMNQVWPRSFRYAPLANLIAMLFSSQTDYPSSGPL